MTNPRIIIVTGANRGIGRAICQSILAKPDIAPLKLLATSRKGEDLALAPASTGNDRRVVYSKLDIADQASVTAFADDVAAEYGRVDVLINNAGVNLDQQYGPENASRTLDVNYRGTLRMCQALLPSLKKSTTTSGAGSGGRIVNLSSIASRLQLYSESIQSRFRNPNLTLEQLEALAEEFESSVAAKSEQSNGFPAPGHAYNVSKACVNGLTRILARENPDVAINACCPGWVSTDMGALVGGGKAPKTPEQGARVPIHIAFDDIGRVSGEYWANDSIRGKGEGSVQEW